MISHPATGLNPDVSASLANGFNGVYNVESILQTGRGYWIKDSSGASYSIATAIKLSFQDIIKLWKL